MPLRKLATSIWPSWIARRIRFNDENLSNGTNMEDLARGNFAACYGRGGYGQAFGKDPAIGGVFATNLRLSGQNVTDGMSNTLAFSELKYRLKGPIGPSFQDTRGTWTYGVMGANIFSTQTGPNSASPDGVWGCRNTPTEGMPCVQTGTPYDALWSAARSYHPNGVTNLLGRWLASGLSTTMSACSPGKPSAAAAAANRWATI